MQFLSYFNITSPISNISHPECKSYFFNSMACRIKHENGFWKYLEFVSFDYRYSPNNTLHKCGFIADGLFQTEMANALAIKNSKLPRNIPHTSTTVTKRESEVLNLIGKGLIAKEIARNLNISVTTVISHRKNLISKLQVKNTAELIKQATKLMLI
ncbi:MAG: response regulator transcription factor [Bacteroidales bacterium]|nr:response regulator transcription factor [Bacteroidales bacterium]